MRPLHPIAHGIDIVEPARIAALLSRHPQRAPARLFTQAELGYAMGTAREAEHLAARFAAKEAVFKALGTGWSRGISWTDIQITRAPSGQPGIELSGEAAAIAEALGISCWLLSLSHVSTLAIASVIGLGH